MLKMSVPRLKSASSFEEDDSNQEEQERTSFGMDPMLEQDWDLGDDGVVETPSRKRKDVGRIDMQRSRSTNSPNSQASGSRHDSSLGLLTKNFLTLFEESTDNSVDLNKAADILKVKKRRLYDITNVLEGVGLFSKKSKNVIQWVNTEAEQVDQSDGHEKKAAEKDILELQELERALDSHLSSINSALEAVCNQPANKEHLYVTDTLIRALPAFSNDTVFALRAPAGTTIELAQPQFGLHVKSCNGPVEVFLVHHAEDATQQQEGPVQHQQATHSQEQHLLAACSPASQAVTPVGMPMGGISGGLPPPSALDTRNSLSYQYRSATLGPHSAGLRRQNSCSAAPALGHAQQQLLMQQYHLLSPNTALAAAALRHEPLPSPVFKMELSFAAAAGSPLNVAGTMYNAFNSAYGEIDVSAWPTQHGGCLPLSDLYREDVMESMHAMPAGRLLHAS
ncbi:hypothetical protein CEUSTIGMA_g873.t1 [Chlamydomonas eustigma]|uniref:E2F/DP family winged-helix DNA-binding domain-containing protein n=1 Tax=Chlamydomonas eustigma TaxID=1157962 RepID=A0A250WRK1_9CHLO|nr:hypothetical protein CEUSTIGMA_g873.t1 [Chlamydomonas eustigma]|eukprot:GAX73421.1 hypothetical protein CEUSTIGMA_g873.t1 [Chlamydomonas eustigma]